MSTRLRRSCLNESGIIEKLGSDPDFFAQPLLAGKLALDQSGNLAHVGSPGEARLEQRHRLAHVLDTTRSRFGNGLVDFLLYFRISHLLRQISGKHAEL